MDGRSARRGYRSRPFRTAVGKSSLETIQANGGKEGCLEAGYGPPVGH